MGINYNNSIVTNGLILCLDAANLRSYPGVGTNWFDISANRTHGILTNSPTYNNEKGGSIVFDGTNDYAVTQATNFTANNDFTYEVIIKSDSTYLTGRGILANKDYWMTGHGAAISHISNPQTIYGYVTTNTSHYDINSTVGPTYGWTHVIMRRNNNDLRFFINGQHRGTTKTIYGTITGESDKFWICSTLNGANTWMGNVGVVRVYNRSLTQEEILQNFNAIRGRFGL